MLYCVILYYIILYYVILYYMLSVFYNTILYCTILYYSILYYTILILYYTIYYSQIIAIYIAIDHDMIMMYVIFHHDMRQLLETRHQGQGAKICRRWLPWPPCWTGWSCCSWDMLLVMAFWLCHTPRTMATQAEMRLKLRIPKVVECFDVFVLLFSVELHGYYWNI